MQTVERDEKSRYTLETRDGVLMVRANQGHSIKVRRKLDSGGSRVADALAAFEGLACRRDAMR